MTEIEPKASTTNSLPRPQAPISGRPRAGRRWLWIFPWLLIVLGAGLVAYPFIPAARYALLKPAPTIPYQNNLSKNNLASLPGLPVVGDKPRPKDNRLVIPSINVDMSILEGPDEKTLNRGGIWHIPKTSDPAHGGNTVLSGHRWQYLPPSSTTLYLLDKVQIGQPIIVYWGGKEYDYNVSGREIVDPSRIEILANTDQPKLTIFTCTPLFSTKQRLVLYGRLIP